MENQFNGDQGMDHTISSIRDVGHKSNSLLLSKFDTQNDASLLNTQDKRGQSSDFRDSDKIIVYNSRRNLKGQITPIESS